MALEPDEVMLAIRSSFAMSILLKATVIAALGLTAFSLARASRAAVRHALLAATFGAMLLLPMTAVLMPPIRVRVRVKVERPATLLPLVSSVTEAGTNIFLQTGRTIASTGASSPHTPKLSLSTLLLAGWIAGIVLFLLPPIVGFWQIRSLRRSGLPWKHGQSVTESLAQSTGIHRRVELLLHEELPGPMTCGVVHPAIVLPRDAENWKPEDLNRAIIHELEHVRRGDSLTCWLARCICALYWFHPIVWMMWRRLLLEAERSCDDVVLGYSEAAAYASQLVDLARRLSLAKRLPALMMASRLDLAARVNAVLDSRRKRGRARVGAVTLVCTAALLLLTAMSSVMLVAAPQTASGKVQFEVASIRPITPDFGAGAAATAGVHVDGAQFRASLTLRGLVAMAWKVRPYQFEAPGWMSLQWYEIAAALPEGHKMGEVTEMLQALLTERFNMKIHRQTKELSVYALTLTKTGISAKEDPLDPVEHSVESVSTSTETTTVSRLQRGAALAIGDDRIEARKFTMTRLADQLSSFVDRRVVDQTGLPADAAYDLTLELTHEDFLATRVRSALAGGMTLPPQAMKLLEASGDSLDIALAKLGLKLESTKTPVEVLVIDSANKVPVQN